MFRVDPFWTSARDQAAREWTIKQSVPGAPMDHPVPVQVQEFVDGAFLPHYAWANGLSMYYGNLHRSAFLLNSLLGAVAVFLALICIAAGITGRDQIRWVLGELVVILGILGLTHVGRRQRWHQRWIDYRMLAERLRVARCACLLGGGGPLVQHAGHLASYGNPLRTWMHWHYRAVERAAGLLPGVSFTGEYLAACREFWRESLVQDQRTLSRGDGKPLLEARPAAALRGEQPVRPHARGVPPARDAPVGRRHSSLRVGPSLGAGLADAALRVPAGGGRGAGGHPRAGRDPSGGPAVARDAGGTGAGCRRTSTPCRPRSGSSTP